MDLSIVVPAYNEERRLQPTIDGWAAWMDSFDGSAELIVSDDGSRDGTAALVERVWAGDPRIRLTGYRRIGAGAQRCGRACWLPPVPTGSTSMPI